MQISYVRLLEQERDLYRLPRDRKRFKKYLSLTIDWETERIRLPLLGMNPMAREHVGEYLDQLLAIDADSIGQKAVEEVLPAVANVPGKYRAALVVCDDLKGGWTNRYSCEYAIRSSPPPPPGQSYQDWLIGVLWVADQPAPKHVRQTMSAAIYRAAYVHRHGPPQTLGALLAQEGWVMVQAGCTEPILDLEEIEYTRDVIHPHWESSDMRTAIECLFGDEAGATLGFTPRGLSHRAGLALALHDARAGVAARPPSSV